MVLLRCINATAVSNLSIWCKENQMRLNYNTTQLLIIKGNKTASIDNHKLDHVKMQRDLGLQVSKNLNWNENCSFRKRKVVCAFFKLKRNISQSVNKNLN